MNSTVRLTKASSAPHSTQQQRSPTLRFAAGLSLVAVLLAGLAGLLPAGSAAAWSPHPSPLPSYRRLFSSRALRRPLLCPSASTRTTAARSVSAAFSLDYDSACLAIDPADANHDGIPDAVSVSVPADFEKSVSLNAADTTGELDIAIWDADSPIAELACSPLSSWL